METTPNCVPISIEVLLFDFESAIHVDLAGDLGEVVSFHAPCADESASSWSIFVDHLVCSAFFSSFGFFSSTSNYRGVTRQKICGFSRELLITRELTAINYGDLL